MTPEIQMMLQNRMMNKQPVGPDSPMRYQDPNMMGKPAAGMDMAKPLPMPQNPRPGTMRPPVANPRPVRPELAAFMRRRRAGGPRAP